MERSSKSTPLDHPTPDRAHRIYFALTNHCNRACPWCSTCSSPQGDTWLSLDDYQRGLPAYGPFEVQLEGGEPTLHPQFLEFVRIARQNPRCQRVVVCTNGVALPRRRERLITWLRSLGEPLTIKVSVNHHLIERDSDHVALVASLRDAIHEITHEAPRDIARGAVNEAGGDRLLVVNVRLRRGFADDDRAVREAIENAGLLPHSNIFFLQRYGFAQDQVDWDAPFAVTGNFTLVNPDGTTYGPDLVARSEAMRVLK